MILRLSALALGLNFAAANPVTAQVADPHAGHHGERSSVTTVNGAVPLGIIRGLDEVTVVLDTLTSDGQRLVITRGIRRAGTRVGIHVHQHGGHTCVLSGTITDFVEGKPDSFWPTGTCYYMPANTPMSAANLGTEDALLMDTFQLPPGAPVITIVEPSPGR